MQSVEVTVGRPHRRHRRHEKNESWQSDLNRDVKGDLNPYARKAAEAARCAGEQGKYWEMHDVLFQNQQALTPQQLQAYAERLQLDGETFGACFAGGKYRALVQQNYDEGVSAGVRGTPSLYPGGGAARASVASPR